MPTPPADPGSFPTPDRETGRHGDVVYYAPAPRAEVSAAALLAIFLRHWRRLIFVPIAAGVIAGALSYLATPRFTAELTFAPEQPATPRIQSPLGNLTGLAGQFGVTLGAAGTRSPRFYAAVLEGREMREGMLAERFADPRPTASPGDSVPLLVLLEVSGTTRSDSILRGLRRLTDALEVVVDIRTDIVTIAFESPYPQLAADVTNRFLQRLTDFDASTRQTRARETRRFIEGRMSEAERVLREDEAALADFYSRNLRWQDSPELRAVESPLRRQVEIDQSVYLTLREEYESSRIEEVNDTPVLTVIDAASPPRRKSRPRRALIVLATGLGVGILLVVFTLAQHFIRHIRRTDETEFRELAGAIDQVGDDLRQIARLPTGRKGR